MEKNINLIMSRFREAHKNISTTTKDELLKITEGIQLCKTTLLELKKVVTNNDFKDTKAEIHFFKHTKILPLSYLIYYKKACSCETYMPKIGYKAKRKYLEENMEAINTFFSVNSAFVNYVRLQSSDMDNCYYTRAFMEKATPIDIEDIYFDPEFNTMHDVLLAKVKANNMYMEYINRKIRELNRVSSNQRTKNRHKSKKRLIYTGKKADLMKLSMGLEEMDVFEGSPTAIVICRALSEAFAVEKNSNLHKVRSEVKASKHPETFLERWSIGLKNDWKMKTALGIRN
ncbi:MAG: RteC domain-containing protein [Allomuricauda sp.]